MKYLLSAISFLTALMMLVPTPAQAASFTFAPSDATFVQGCEVRVNVFLDTEGEESSAADMFVRYDPSKLEFIDQDSGTPGVQIKDGRLYSVYAGNIVEDGMIRSTAFNVLGSYNGRGRYATLVFKSKPDVSIATLLFDFTPGSTTDSNVANTLGEDILTEAFVANLRFEEGVCPGDEPAPPVFEPEPEPEVEPEPVEPVCGNKVVEEGEQCEPANTEVCDANCQMIIKDCPECPAEEVKEAAPLEEVTIHGAAEEQPGTVTQVVTKFVSSVSERVVNVVQTVTAGVSNGIVVLADALGLETIIHTENAGAVSATLLFAFIVLLILYIREHYKLWKARSKTKKKKGSRKKK